MEKELKEIFIGDTVSIQHSLRKESIGGCAYCHKKHNSYSDVFISGEKVEQLTNLPLCYNCIKQDLKNQKGIFRPLNGIVEAILENQKKELELREGR